VWRAPLELTEYVGAVRRRAFDSDNGRASPKEDGARADIVDAWQLVSEAQYDNHSRLGGHAARAKELLSQANDELRLAADVANEHRW
jgi:hypothetical protein